MGPPPEPVFVTVRFVDPSGAVVKILRFPVGGKPQIGADEGR